MLIIFLIKKSKSRIFEGTHNLKTLNTINHFILKVKYFLTYRLEVKLGKIQ